MLAHHSQHAPPPPPPLPSKSTAYTRTIIQAKTTSTKHSLSHTTGVCNFCTFVQVFHSVSRSNTLERRSAAEPRLTPRTPANRADLRMVLPKGAAAVSMPLSPSPTAPAESPLAHHLPPPRKALAAIAHDVHALIGLIFVIFRLPVCLP